MPACPRATDYSNLPPPGFASSNVASKRSQLLDLLQKLADKYREEPQSLEQLPKSTDLLLTVAQYTLLTTTNAIDEQRQCLQQIAALTENLLVENEQIPRRSLSPCPEPNPVSTVVPIVIDATSPPENSDDFSLSDLANEYLQDETSPSTSNEKETASSEFEDLSSSQSSPIIGETLFKSPLESILFSHRLSSQDAADDAEEIWKEESSSFGQIFCAKTEQIESVVIRRSSDCLLDRSLYERLSRLIALLPKECLPSSVPNFHLAPNTMNSRSNVRPQRPKNKDFVRMNAPPPLGNYQQRPRPSNTVYVNNNFNYAGPRYYDPYAEDQRQQHRYPPRGLPRHTYPPGGGPRPQLAQQPRRNNSSIPQQRPPNNNNRKPGGPTNAQPR